MALSKSTMELGAAGAPLAVMPGGFHHRGARMDQRFDQMDAQFTKRLDRMDARLDRMDARLDRMDARLDKMEARLDRMDARVDAISDRLARGDGLLRAVLRGMSPSAVPGQSSPSPSRRRYRARRPGEPARAPAKALSSRAD